MRVLFLDNHEVFARTVTDTFLVGHEVDIVGTVDEAKRAAGRTSYEVALVDHDLDDETGVAFVRWARGQGYGLPIIAVSARDEGNEALVQAGASAICAKTKFAQIGGVLADVLRGQSEHRPVAVADLAVVGARAGGLGDDRAEIIACDDGLVLVVVDGAGGMGGGSAAADAVVAAVRRRSRGRISTMDVTDLVVSVDRRLANAAAGGQAAAVVATVTAAGVRGASVGDCGAWLVTTGGFDDLTRHQARKPLVGSGAAVVTPFAAPLEGTLVLATDGLFKYAPPARICETARRPSLHDLPTSLTALVRLASGRLADDVAVVACRRARVGT